MLSLTYLVALCLVSYSFVIKKIEKLMQMCFRNKINDEPMSPLSILNDSERMKSYNMIDVNAIIICHVILHLSLAMIWCVK